MPAGYVHDPTRNVRGGRRGQVHDHSGYVFGAEIADATIGVMGSSE
ncbi:hypothetical protein Rhow_006680 [Rhodococcus wratislaviensis]|uniref:Uncharacterized protein n=1 Tax=Rhodococcus wratislaviensis TaxID=44752 RepID=A0A402CG07_RHOWR|nr:hypothetical protein Rhow_006680 [Rhodococcus wratislaviensis]